LKILAIDTASNICGVSILEDTNLICNMDISTSRTHSENLMPLIQKAFNTTKLSLSDISLICCDIGPGSFTGIRIGVATAKAFSDSINIPCSSVSSLESLAYSIKNNGLICSIIDCKNDNCYFALYNLIDSKYLELIPPSANSLEDVIKILRNYSETITFVGDGSIIYNSKLAQNIPNSIFADDKLNYLNSYNVGLCGLNKFKTNSSLEFLPLYLKKPQAQRQLEEKLNEKK
jgi:tRNA threonylcarbamoyl adenosine modification protein YeaZ